MTAHSDATSDERLVQATLAGDDGAFAELVARHKKRIFAMAARFTRNDHELDDVCQEIFVKAYRNLSSYRVEAPFEHWLSRVGVRACYDFLRKKKRHSHDVSLEDGAGELADARAHRDRQSAEAADLLEFALPQLSADERLVVTLLELEEKSVREVAELTGWSEANVKVRAHRARRSLRNILETHHER
jgi:RNA polymerase sigma-70 factor (ECF subfamily)